MHEVSGKAVGSVDHRRCKATMCEPLAQGEPDRRLKMAPKKWTEARLSGKATAQELETELGGAQSPTDVDQVAWASPGPSQTEAVRDISQDGDGHHHAGLTGRITAYEPQIEFSSGAGKATKETIEPTPSAGRGQSEGQEEIARASTHGRQITCSAS